MTPDRETFDPVALKPCPFCGGHELDADTNLVQCKCGATGPECPTDDDDIGDTSDAIAAWNRRATQADAAVPVGEYDECMWTDKPCTCGGGHCEQVNFSDDSATPAPAPAPDAGTVSDEMVERPILTGDPISVLQKLADEYRPTMDKKVLHSWAGDVVAALAAAPVSPVVGDAVERAVIAYNTTPPGALANKDQMRAALASSVAKPSSCVTKVEDGYLHEWTDADGDRHRYVHPTDLSRPTPGDRLPTREEAAAAAALLLRCNGHDLTIWGGEDLLDDCPTAALKALSCLSHPAQGWREPDKWRSKLNLWFFRDLSDEQRLKLFSLHELPVHEIGKVHGFQRKALDRCLPSAPAEGSSNE